MTLLLTGFIPIATGASSNPCSETFCGSTVESEVEVKNVANFLRRNKAAIKAYLTIHSYSQLLLFPYSYTFDLAADHSELVSPLSDSSSNRLKSHSRTCRLGRPGTTWLMLSSVAPAIKMLDYF